VGTDVRVAAVALLAAIVYGGVLMLQPLEPKLLVSFTDIGMIFGSGTATLCAVLAVRRHSSRQARKFWAFIALGLCCWFLGDIV
jgi:hypothetical protein